MEKYWQEGLLLADPGSLKTLEGKIKEIVARGPVDDPDMVSFKIEVENREYPFLISGVNIPYIDEITGSEEERKWEEEHTTFPLRDMINEFGLTDIRDLALKKVEATVFYSPEFKQCVALRFY